MRLKGHALVVDLIDSCERENLKSPAVRENRAIPVHEPMKLTQSLDTLVTGPQIEVISVAQNNLGIHSVELVRRNRLHRPWVPTGMKTGVKTTEAFLRWLADSFSPHFIGRLQREAAGASALDTLDRLSAPFRQRMTAVEDIQPL